MDARPQERLPYHDWRGLLPAFLQQPTWGSSRCWASLNANISASGGTYSFSIVWLSELAISVPTPVVAWCGFPPEDFSRCVDENDWDGGSRANWLEWPSLE